MAKHQQRTKVIVDDRDVSHLVQRVDIPREPGEANMATVTFFTEPLQVDDDGTLIIEIDTRE
jgi:hypothetical protein